MEEITVLTKAASKSLQEYYCKNLIFQKDLRIKADGELIIAVKPLKEKW